MSKKIMTRFIDIKYILRLVAHEITARRSRDYGSCPTTLRLVVILFLMMVLGVNEMWGQDYSGIWYIASEVDSYDNENTKYGSNTSTPATHCYLVPAAKDGTEDLELAYYTAGES